jgi:hypothetical protein
MIQKIFHKKKLFALIIDKNFRKLKGVNFLTSPEDTQQIGFMKHKKNHIVLPHLHKKRLTKINFTTEVILLLKGILRVDFYDKKRKYLFSKKINAGQIIMLVSGGHGFKVIKDVEMIEVKQGPYNPKKDKQKFDFIKDNKIKLK